MLFFKNRPLNFSIFWLCPFVCFLIVADRDGVSIGPKVIQCLNYVTLFKYLILCSFPLFNQMICLFFRPVKILGLQFIQKGWKILWYIWSIIMKIQSSTSQKTVLQLILLYTYIDTTCLMFIIILLINIFSKYRISWLW